MHIKNSNLNGISVSTTAHHLVQVQLLPIFANWTNEKTVGTGCLIRSVLSKLQTNGMGFFANLFGQFLKDAAP
jgi:hypothetical protein